MPTPPGVILKEHYLEPRHISITSLARAVGCSRNHMSHIIHGNARIEASLAIKIARVLDTTPQFWLNLQNAVDLYLGEQEMKNWRPAMVYHSLPASSKTS